jgi:hypothetical protein
MAPARRFRGNGLCTASQARYPNFGDGFTIPPGSAVTSLSRFTDHIDLFVAGRDGGIYSTFWDASTGWFGHWFGV